MEGQAHSALAIAKIVTGDVHERKAIWRIDQTAPEGRYTGGFLRCAIARLRRRASSYRNSDAISSAAGGRVRAGAQALM